MSRPFDPNHLIKTLSPVLAHQLYARLYAKHGLSNRTGLRGRGADKHRRDFDPILTTLRRTHAPLVEDLLLVLQDVHYLADPRGLGVLDAEVVFDVPPRVAEFRDQHWTSCCVNVGSAGRGSVWRFGTCRKQCSCSQDSRRRQAYGNVRRLI
jgi:hypothetical protein